MSYEGEKGWDQMIADNARNRDLALAGKCLACHGYGRLTCYIGCNCVRDKPYESTACNVCGGTGMAPKLRKGKLVPVECTHGAMDSMRRS